MLAGHFHLVTGREVFDQFDVGYQTAAGKRTFEQVVRKNGILLDATLERRLEGIDIVKTLAGEGAFTRQVLIDVRNREDIGVDAATDRKDALEDRGFLTGGQRRGDARLKHAVAGDDAARLRVVNRAVDRMVHLADELGDSLAHQARIGIQRHDIFHAGGNAVGTGQEVGVTVAAQQKIQFMQLAALALPAHPRTFGLVVEAAAMQQEEALANILVALVETGDFLLGIIQHFRIGIVFLGLGIRPVGNERKGNRAMRIGKVVDFQIADEFVHLVAIADQARHDDERAGVFGNAFLEFEANQTRRPHEEGDKRVEQARCAFRCR